MIKTKLSEVREAFDALISIGGVALPPKAAYRVARLISKLQSACSALDETHGKLILGAGGVYEHGVVVVKGIARNEGESDEDYLKRETAHLAKIAQLKKDVQELMSEDIEIDSDPIPLSLFDHENPERVARLRPVDIANAGPFIEG